MKDQTITYLLDMADRMTITERLMFANIMKEFVKSKQKHPTFADGSLTLAASIVSEECGEMCREVNQFVQEGKTDSDTIMEEAAHTAVTAIRLMAMVDNIVVGQPDKTYNEVVRMVSNLALSGEDEHTIRTKLKLIYNIERLK